MLLNHRTHFYCGSYFSSKILIFWILWKLYFIQLLFDVLFGILWSMAGLDYFLQLEHCSKIKCPVYQLSGAQMFVLAFC